uniref:Protein kinase domain-containing protein n=1 Tax=Haptolina brevifila TaxID=156173 RepID=A0A7S2DTI0_9EUKA|mmetsp:Transcript_42664/g.85614  ORF Transcript_42664/g.85614 Transcript_42664/m.85614 type:complete len:614 (+) Transcript_42664:3-1844(+)
MEGVEEGTVWDGGGHRYALEKVVGHGAFGIVWRARAEDGEVVAIKKVMLDRRYHNRELQMMKVMEHENVVRLRHYFEKAGRKKDETFLHLVMDYLPETIRSTALKHHKRAKRFHVDHVKAYLYQTFRALEYIHARRICHRDIKPDNLLCDPASLKCRLCDFGCSKVLVKGQPNVSYICSRYYRAPELMFGATEYAVSVDVWSVGTILMELLLGHLPFQGQDSTQQHLVEIMKLLGTPSDRDLVAMRATCVADDLPKLKAYPWERMFPAHTPQEAVDLAQRLLRYDPDQRLTASQALAHPFFDGVETLLDCSSTSSSSMPPPPPSLSPDGPRTVRSAEEWKQRVHEHFEGLRGGMPLMQLVETMQQDSTISTLMRDGNQESTPNQVVSTLRQELSSALRKRDEAVRGLQSRLVNEGQKHQLPFEGQPAPTANGAGSSADGGDADVVRLSQLEANTKEAQRLLTEALAERTEIAARVKAAQQQLEGTAAVRASSSTMDGAREEASVQTEVSEESRGPPGFGRRAPPMPTRQQTMEQGANGRFSPMINAKPMQLQTDNLGQVTPLGSYSPGSMGCAASEGVSPGCAPLRSGSASGRRRSRLSADKTDDAPLEEGET